MASSNRRKKQNRAKAAAKHAEARAAYMILRRQRPSWPSCLASTTRAYQSQAGWPRRYCGRVHPWRGFTMPPN